MEMNGEVWLVTNWKLLEKWAKRWHHDEWRDLLSHYAMWIHSNWSKFQKIPDGEERIKFSQTWMKNNVSWKNSEFNKTIRTNNLPEEWEFKEEAEEAHLDVYCESDREDIREFMLDLVKRYSETDVNRILLVRKIYLQLPLHERVLYDLYFNQMLSMRAIGEKIDLPLSAVYQMILELKNKLQELCNLKK